MGEKPQKNACLAALILSSNACAALTGIATAASEQRSANISDRLEQGIGLVQFKCGEFVEKINA